MADKGHQSQPKARGHREGEAQKRRELLFVVAGKARRRRSPGILVSRQGRESGKADKGAEEMRISEGVQGGIGMSEGVGDVSWEEVSGKWIPEC